MSKRLALIAGIALTLSAPLAQARDQIRVVGSSTVYPFTTVVAEEFGKNTEYKTPIIESTGTGGGFKLFCAGVGDTHPDISNASRAVKASEIALCKENGVNDIMEIKIGYDGIVIANSVDAAQYTLTKEQLFLALARQVPVDGKLVENPYQTWNEIDASLPKTGIEVYGPPPTSGTRDAFVELVMEEACEHFSEYSTAFPDKNVRKKSCALLREDGKYIEAGENDNLIVQKLAANPDALGIFGYSFLDQNGDTVHGSIIDGAEPSFENIADGSYSISRPLFLYVKKANVKTTIGLKAFLEELVSDKAIGQEGYLTFKGLIPLTEEEKTAVEAVVSEEKSL